MILFTWGGFLTLLLTGMGWMVVYTQLEAAALRFHTFPDRKSRESLQRKRVLFKRWTTLLIAEAVLFLVVPAQGW